MKVTIDIENGDQEVVVTRERADVVRTAGPVVGGVGMSLLFELAVGAARRALELPDPAARAQDGTLRTENTSVSRPARRSDPSQGRGGDGPQWDDVGDGRSQDAVGHS